MMVASGMPCTSIGGVPMTSLFMIRGSTFIRLSCWLISLWILSATSRPCFLPHSRRNIGQIVLTEEQQAAYGALLPHLEDTAPHSALLYGVTGSGKTLVFLKLIERCLQLGRKALVLVPEISLTPQMILRLKSQFGRRVADPLPVFR